MSLGSSTACCHPESKALPATSPRSRHRASPCASCSSRESGGEQGRSSGAALQAAAPGQRVRPSAATPQPPRENKAGRMIPSCGRGRRGGGFAVICGGSVCSEVPPPAAAPAGHPCGPRPIPGAGMQRRCSESRGLRPQQLPERLL